MIPGGSYFANIGQVIASEVDLDEIFHFTLSLDLIKPGCSGLAILFENSEYLALLPREGQIICLPSGGLRDPCNTIYNSPIVRRSEIFGDSFIAGHMFQYAPRYNGNYFIFFTKH